MRVHDDLDELALIRPEERDYQLKLQDPNWGETLNRWHHFGDPVRHFARVVDVHEYGKKVSALHECIIPFPSAPIYGINRKAEYGKSLTRPNMHTVRVLQRPKRGSVQPRRRPIRRLFVLHNGLNETRDLRLYYRLADWILTAQESTSSSNDAACLIMPFPGHLMHSPFPDAFSETPLSRYLNDAGELFRQFLRYMVGMRWLLSMIVDSDAEDWMVGGELIPTHEVLSKLTSESDELYKDSGLRLKRADEMRKHQSDAGPVEKLHIGKRITEDQAEHAKLLLRAALRRDTDRAPKSLRVHVVGYSLGGFLAQSVFFAWPQIVSSCTTICSGGALSALSPTAFAEPEEWQSVLHALRPELSNSMLQGRLGDDRKSSAKNEPAKRVAGMPLQRFGYFQRIFEQVFLQEDRGSYRERLSEYALRMLFVSGGADPIVPPANILDASPKEGTTMLSIAGMTHFLGQDPKTGRRKEAEEKEQRDFWLPEAGGLIARAAIRSEQIHRDERRIARELLNDPNPPDPPSPQVDPRLSSSNDFESALDWVLGAVEENRGWLFICRNTLPAAFIDREHFTRWGAALHHHDVRIQQYGAGLRRRASSLEKAPLLGRTTLIVPKSLQRWFIYLTAQFDAHSDAPSGRRTTEEERREIWKRFETSWWHSIRQFDAGNIGLGLDEKLDAADPAPSLSLWAKAAEKYTEVTHLPDVWISIASDATISSATNDRNEIHRNFLGGVLRLLNNTESIEKDLERGAIRIVQVSGAEFNPRYRGRIEKSPTPAKRLLARCAGGLIRSVPMRNPNPPEE